MESISTSDSDNHTPFQQTYTALGPLYQMFHPSTDAVRIGIPTAHIYGRDARDAWRPHAMDLVEMCGTHGRMVLEHDGGHEVPRGPGASEDVCDVFEAVVAVAKAGHGVGIGELVVR